MRSSVSTFSQGAPKGLKALENKGYSIPTLPWGYSD